MAKNTSWMLPMLKKTLKKYIQFTTFHHIRLLKGLLYLFRRSSILVIDLFYKEHEASMADESTPYQVIPRKFRPQTFESVLGQAAIVTTLKNALRFHRLAHAYLFCGCRGTGKTTLARVFAKALNCGQLTENQEPCNACPSCLEILSGRSLDVLEIDGASNRGIDDIRQINETIGYAPASGKFKIYIIDEVHMLTKEAFNALLKTLEEPPANVKFFFATTEPHKVLPTIISRCQRFDLNRIPVELMQAKLKSITQTLNIACQEEALSLIAHLSEGSLRDAESLLDQIICYAEQPITAESVTLTLGLMPKEHFFALDHAIAEQNYGFAFELSHAVFSSGKELSYFLDNLIEHFRSLLQIRFHKPTFFLNPIASRGSCKTQGSSLFGGFLAKFRFFFGGLYTHVVYYPPKKNRNLAQKAQKIDRT
jgi:DNA polymerase III subunit gamma/tau